MTFEESDLSFMFTNTNWWIKKYDTHRYFKILSGAGIKGVDFLGIYNNQTIVFFEIKNFHTNHPTKPPSYTVFSDTEKFIHRIADKLEDTTTAIQVIIQYLQRKWWYRFYLNWTSLFPKLLIANRDWYFWHKIHQLAQHKDAQVFVLWLEIDQHYSPISRKKLEQKITRKLTDELTNLVNTIHVANHSNPVFEDSLRVKRTI